MSSDRVEELSRERGWHGLSRRDRSYVRFRDALHPLGFHHRVHVFTYVESMDRLVDMGVRCRVCGR